MLKNNIIYVAHPYGGDPKNVEKIKKIIRELREANPDNVYISPVLCFGFYYNDTEYLDGIEECLAVLDRCNGIILCGDWKNSRGCNIEYGYAKARNIGIFELQDSGKVKTLQYDY